MRVRIAKERSDLTDLVAAAIKATYNTRVPCEVERCLDVLNQLKSLPLSVKDLGSSDSIIKLESLKRHRNPNIRKETQALFHTWSKMIYAHGSDNTCEAALAKSRLHMKKHVLKRCLKPKEDERSLTHDAVVIKKSFGLLDLKKKEEQRSQGDQAENVEKATKPTEKSRTFTEKDSKEETKTNLNPCRRDNYVQKKTKSEVVGNQKMCYVTAMARRNLTNKDGRQVTPKTLITCTRRDDASRNPKSATLKAKTEKMVELFEAAKKAADMANVKGILLGKKEASRCVEALSLLMRINITPNPKEPGRMMEKLEGLTRHKDRKICNAASALLQLWSQRIVEQEHKDNHSKALPKTRVQAILV